MKKQQLKSFLQSLDGTIFTVTFVKADKSVRTMNARLGVTKGLRGGADSTAHMDKYMNVYDMVKGGYRKINLNTICSIKAASSELIVQSEEEAIEALAAT